MSKLSILIIITTFLFSVNCTCKSGYFTRNDPCDTKATRIPCRDYTSTIIQEGEWQYFYQPLDSISGRIYLYMKANYDYPDLFVIFQPAEQYELPNNTLYAVSYTNTKSDNSEIYFSFLLNGIENMQKGRMLVGLYNRGNEKNAHVEILYGNPQGNCQWQTGLDAFDIWMIILGGSVIVSIVCCCGKIIWDRNRGCVLRRKRREIENLPRRQNAENPRRQRYVENPESPPSERVQMRSQDNTQASGLLPFFLKYFPKRRFDELENPFKETGCSVCLEHFLPETVCHQFYCYHIFHGKCIQKWLEEHNSCPACRLPLGIKAVEEFLEAQERNEGNISNAEERSP